MFSSATQTAESSKNDDSDVQVTLEDLFVKLTSNWTITSRGRKSSNKRGRPTKSGDKEAKETNGKGSKSRKRSKPAAKNNMIVMKL